MWRFGPGFGLSLPAAANLRLLLLVLCVGALLYLAARYLCRLVIAKTGYAERQYPRQYEEVFPFHENPPFSTLMELPQGNTMENSGK